jgi:hypothetical protein
MRGTNIQNPWHVFVFQETYSMRLSSITALFNVIEIYED